MSGPCVLLMSDTKQPHKVFPGALTRWHSHQSPSRKFPPVLITAMKRTTKPLALVMLGHNKFHIRTGAALKVFEYIEMYMKNWTLSLAPRDYEP